MKDIIVTTIRIPRDLWLALRRLQETGAIESIQQAVIDGLRKLVSGKPGKGDRL